MDKPVHEEIITALRLPSKEDRDSADKLHQTLAELAETNDTLMVADSSGKVSQIALTPLIVQLLTNSLKHISKGHAIEVLAVDRSITEAQAADVLNVPSGYLVDLLKQGLIDSYTHGRRRHVQTEDVLDYKKARDAKRKAALDELARSDSEFI